MVLSTHYYAQINGAGIVFAVTQAHSAIADPALVSIDFLDQSLLGKKYENGQFVEVPQPAPEPPVWAWYIDIGPFTDRLGLASAAIDLSSEQGVVVIRNDLARRKWIDLKDPRVIAALWYLAGQPHPVLGTLAQPLLTAAVVTSALSTAVSAEENLALRKLYFS